MIEIRITGDSFSQVKKEVLAFFSEATPKEIKEVFDPKTAETDRGFVADRMNTHTQEKIKEAEDQKQQERKAKAKTKKAKEKEVAEKTNQEKVLTPSKEEVHDALQRVAAELNLNAARDILLEFGCERVSDLKETQYLDFVAACDSAIQG